MTKAVFDLINDLAINGGTFNGDAYVGTLENDGTGLSPFHDFDSKVSAELKAKLDELKETRTLLAATREEIARHSITRQEFNEGMRTITDRIDILTQHIARLPKRAGDA
jgi:basic membrane lipoprotein Med (substrate-binding protein (PBP1-ABC) superfamily)